MRGPTNAIKGGARVVHEQIVLPCVFKLTTARMYVISGEYAQQYLWAEDLYMRGKVLRTRIKLSSDIEGFDPYDGSNDFHTFASVSTGSNRHAGLKLYSPYSGGATQNTYSVSVNSNTGQVTLTNSYAQTGSTTRDDYIAIDLVYLDE